MIDQSVQYLARKYATAFLGIVDMQMDRADLEKLTRLSVFLQNHQSAIYLLGLSIIPIDHKKKQMLGILEKFDLKQLLTPLILLLIQDKRLVILADILDMICELYCQKNNIIPFSIESYPRISKNDIEELTRFLARSTDCAIIYTDRENKNLIAGIRMESTTYLWEYSIAQQLRNVRRRTLR